MQKIRNEHCDACDLSTACDTVCIMPSVPFKAKMMVIAEFPSFSDDKNGDILSDKYSEVFWTVLTDVIGGDADLVYPTFLVKCKPISGGKPDNEHVKACLGYLEKEIDAVKPDSILCLGDTVSKLVCGVKSLQRERGRVHDLKIGNHKAKVIPTYTPFYVSKNDRALKPFAEDVQSAYNIAVGFENLEAESNVTIVQDFDQVEELIGYIKQTGQVCFDFETTGLDTRADNFKATLLSMSFQHGSSWVIPLEHHESIFDRGEVTEIIHLIGREIFANPEIDKIAHNLKFDWHVAASYGWIDFRGRLDDPMLMHHLLDEDNRHGLKELVGTYLSEYAGYEDAVSKYKWDEIPLKILAIYGGYDTDLDFRLKTFFESWLMEDERLYRIYRNMTIPAMKALWAAEHEGMLIDVDLLEQFIQRAEDLYVIQEEKLRDYMQVQRYEDFRRQELVDEAIEKLEDKITKEKANDKPRLYLIKRNRDKITDLKVGNVNLYEGVNFNSPAQVGGLLYSRAGFKYKKKFDKRKNEEVAGTGKDVLNELNDGTGFIADLLVLRSIAKTKSTYLQGIFDRLDSENKIHTSFLLHGTESGRLSSRDPNLQNLPNMAKLTSEIAKEVVGMVKKVFIVPKDHTMLQADYSQAELRTIAEFATETNMLNAYNNGVDIHALTGANLKGVTLDEFVNLPKEEYKLYRFRAKAGNFGLIYRMSPEGFVDYAKTNYSLELTLKESIEYNHTFFDLYPEILTYHAMYIAKAQKFGYVRTLFGRKRHTPDIDHDNGFKRGLDERVAINSPIQGTAGEFTIFAIALLKNRLDRSVKIVNTVHDSIIFYIPDGILAETLKIIKYTAENLPTKKYFGRELEKIGMVVDMEKGKVNWKDMEEFDIEDVINAN